MRVIFAFAFVIFFGWRDEFQKKYFMKFYEFYELMIFFYELMKKWGIDEKMGNWWKNGELMKKWGSLDNWQSLRPITLWGSVKKSELINYKGWQGVQRDLVQTTFPSEWQAGTVPETWPVSVVLWPGSAPSHKLCEQGHSLDGKTGSHFSSHIIRVHIARICKLYLLAFCLSISFAPITHFFAQIC